MRRGCEKWEIKARRSWRLWWKCLRISSWVREEFVGEFKCWCAKKLRVCFVLRMNFDVGCEDGGALGLELRTRLWAPDNCGSCVVTAFRVHCWQLASSDGLSMTSRSKQLRLYLLWGQRFLFLLAIVLQLLIHWCRRHLRLVLVIIVKPQTTTIYL